MIRNISNDANILPSIVVEMYQPPVTIGPGTWVDKTPSGIIKFDGTRETGNIGSGSLSFNNSTSDNNHEYYRDRHTIRVKVLNEVIWMGMTNTTDISQEEDMKCGLDESAYTYNINLEGIERYLTKRFMTYDWSGMSIDSAIQYVARRVNSGSMFVSQPQFVYKPSMLSYEHALNDGTNPYSDVDLEDFSFVDTDAWAILKKCSLELSANSTGRLEYDVWLDYVTDSDNYIYIMPDMVNQINFIAGTFANHDTSRINVAQSFSKLSNYSKIAGDEDLSLDYDPVYGNIVFNNYISSNTQYVYPETANVFATISKSSGFTGGPYSASVPTDVYIRTLVDIGPVDIQVGFTYYNQSNNPVSTPTNTLGAPVNIIYKGTSAGTTIKLQVYVDPATGISDQVKSISSMSSFVGGTDGDKFDIIDSTTRTWMQPSDILGVFNFNGTGTGVFTDGITLTSSEPAHVLVHLANPTAILTPIVYTVDYYNQSSANVTSIQNTFNNRIYNDTYRKLDLYRDGSGIEDTGVFTIHDINIISGGTADDAIKIVGRMKTSGFQQSEPQYLMFQIDRGIGNVISSGSWSYYSGPSNKQTYRCSLSLPSWLLQSESSYRPALYASDQLSCGYQADQRPNNLRDNNLGAPWTHNVNHKHYVVFDMGSSEQHTGIKFYRRLAERDANQNIVAGTIANTFNATVYVSDDVKSFGTAILTAVSILAEGWSDLLYSNIFSFDNVYKGRFVKVEFTNTTSSTDGFMRDILEVWHLIASNAYMLLYSSAGKDNLSPGTYCADGGYIYLRTSDGTNPTTKVISYSTTMSEYGRIDIAGACDPNGFDDGPMCSYTIGTGFTDYMTYDLDPACNATLITSSNIGISDVTLTIFYMNQDVGSVSSGEIKIDAGTPSGTIIPIALNGADTGVRRIFSFTIVSGGTAGDSFEVLGGPAERLNFHAPPGQTTYITSKERYCRFNLASPDIAPFTFSDLSGSNISIYRGSGTFHGNSISKYGMFEDIVTIPEDVDVAQGYAVNITHNSHNPTYQMVIGVHAVGNFLGKIVSFPEPFDSNLTKGWSNYSNHKWRSSFYSLMTFGDMASLWVDDNELISTLGTPSGPGTFSQTSDHLIIWISAAHLGKWNYNEGFVQLETPSIDVKPYIILTEDIDASGANFAFNYISQSGVHQITSSYTAIPIGTKRGAAIPITLNGGDTGVLRIDNVISSGGESGDYFVIEGDLNTSDVSYMRIHNPSNHTIKSGRAYVVTKQSISIGDDVRTELSGFRYDYRNFDVCEVL
jgi:hypothetical protein